MEQKYNWDLTKFHKDVESCEKKITEIQQSLTSLSKMKGTLNEPQNFLNYLKTKSQIENEISYCYIFANGNLDVNVSSKTFQELLQKVYNLYTEFETTISFAQPEIKALGNEYLLSLKKLSMFDDWQKTLDNYILTNDHTLSENEENIIAQFNNVTTGFNSIQKSCFNSDIDYGEALDSNNKPHKITAGNASSFSTNPDRVLRKNVSNAIKSAKEKYGNSMAQNFIYYIKSQVTLAKIKKYNSVQDVYFSNYKLDKKIYDYIIEETIKNKDFLEDYYKTKKSLLGYETLYNYDLFVELDKKQKSYTFEEGVDLIKKALSVLGKDYISLIDKAVNERWIDVYPKPNKRAGGYCSGNYGKSYVILMNWTNNLDSVYTLAHELGHAIHFYIMHSKQEKQNSDFPIFLLEVSSTFNELLLTNYLINNSKNNFEKLTIIDKILNDIVATMFRQIEFSQFEDFCYKTIEQDGILSKEILQDKWNEVRIKPYTKFANMDSMGLLGWENIYHFYNLSYYVWQYSLAYLISYDFLEKINKDKSQIQNYFEFLSGSKTEYPTEFLKRLGIDILNKSFYEQGFKNFNVIKDNFISLSKLIKS